MAIISELLNDTKVVAHRAGTILFMSTGVLKGRGPHTAADDLESFFYVLIFICLEYSGPGRQRIWDDARDMPWDIYHTYLNHWLLGEDLSRLAGGKACSLISESSFRADVLNEFPRYFQGLSPCLINLWEALFCSREAITHDIFMKILGESQEQDFDENVPDDSPPNPTQINGNPTSNDRDAFNEDDKEPKMRKRRRMNPGIPTAFYVCDSESSCPEIKFAEALCLLLRLLPALL
ncbi:hypothetical protein AMATHDRAFT_7634 [Amanita thiersii Skay4041]|uniref:Fungal-type protein kinase domain-containing protein n=1 Tax=Amanita thiersii Skay4041 TaxID=703135 RepID=A0A2A9NG18_9AGAR|nr:hypothetical protein AMATHDRAFT_7634 [Amanita thiersii Skay4041]